MEALIHSEVRCLSPLNILISSPQEDGNLSGRSQERLCLFVLTKVMSERELVNKGPFSLPFLSTACLIFVTVRADKITKAMQGMEAREAKYRQVRPPVCWFDFLRLITPSVFRSPGH